MSCYLTKCFHYCQTHGIAATVQRAVDHLRNDYQRYSNLSSEQYEAELKKWYKRKTGEELDLQHPKTFNEKIQWLKLYDSTPLKTRLADKYLVRDYVRKKLGDEYLIPLLGVWDSFDEINFSALPDKFVLKANHGSGWNIVVKDKAKFDIAKARKKFNRWMKTNFAFYTGFELHYKDIQPKIIAEEYIEQLDGNLIDYKIHCFNGNAKLIQVIGNRDHVTHSGYEAFFDIEWNRNTLMYNTYYEYELSPQCPACISELLMCAKMLSEDFNYVRIDLYDVNGKLLFGEMTFTPASGIGQWKNNADNLLVGSWIELHKCAW